MIFEVLQIITDEINNFFEESDPVSLNNIASILTEPVNTKGIMLTLVNLKEEVSLKNMPNQMISGTKTINKNPIVNLNMCVMFSANYDLYTEALKSISKVISFFQGKKVFTNSNTVFNRAALNDIANFKIVVELFTPSFEELNHVWGILGGKQIPSVMYKINLIEIERETILSKGGLIREVSGSLEHKN